MLTLSTNCWEYGQLNWKVIMIKQERQERNENVEEENSKRRKKQIQEETKEN